jgi:hypothetical protein
VTVGPLVSVEAMDTASVGPAGEASALWNLYHPAFAGGRFMATARTVPQAELDTPDPNVVGTAVCNTPCTAAVGRWCCGVVELRVVDDLGGAAAAAVFFHEIGHVVIPPDATAPGRRIGATGHWVPEEHAEVMGATLEFPVFVADYTAAAPDPEHSAVCVAGCACVSSGTPNTPAVCAAHVKPTDRPAYVHSCTYDDCTGSTLVAVGILVCWVTVCVVAMAALIDGESGHSH